MLVSALVLVSVSAYLAAKAGKAQQLVPVKVSASGKK